MRSKIRGTDRLLALLLYSYAPGNFGSRRVSQPPNDKKERVPTLAAMRRIGSSRRNLRFAA